MSDQTTFHCVNLIGDSRGIQECTLLCRPKLHLGDKSATSAKIAPKRETPHKAPAVTSCRGVPDLGDLAASRRSPAQLSADNAASPSPVQVLLNVLQAPARAQQAPQPAALSLSKVRINKDYCNIFRGKRLPNTCVPVGEPPGVSALLCGVPIIPRRFSHDQTSTINPEGDDVENLLANPDDRDGSSENVTGKSLETIKSRMMSFWYRDNRQSWHTKILLTVNVLVASLLEVFWSALSARIALRGMMNRLPESSYVNGATGNVKLDEAAVGKRRPSAPRPDILDHDRRLSESLQNLTALHGLRNSGPRLPLPESSREFRERVESNIKEKVPKTISKRAKLAVWAERTACTAKKRLPTAALSPPQRQQRTTYFLQQPPSPVWPYLYRVDSDERRSFGVVTLRVLVPVTVHVCVMVPMMLETRRSPVSLPRVRVARVQRMHLLQVMMVIVHVIQTAVRSRIGVRRRGLAGYARAHVMMIHARMSEVATDTYHKSARKSWGFYSLKSTQKSPCCRFLRIYGKFKNAKMHVVLCTNNPEKRKNPRNTMDSVIKGQKFLASLITRTLQTMPLSFPRMQQAKWCAMHNASLQNYQ
ncbi:hypothetical protein WN51_13008 [Melipona quadrifasciata]|uniref:Uncharacterized protein n=1 Tax=Melipona quadrifasciata TaxID=166423 RepID=A0A0N0U7F2_9HYME|nr:hypothetical protein WN51_13008 [Melipona quadrifasciata]